MNRIKLAIFDLDGVITSTTNEHFKAWSLLFIKNFGIQLSSELEKFTKGVSRHDSLKILLKHSGITIDNQMMFEKLASDKNVIYNELISEFDHTKIFDGVHKIIDFLKTKGVKIALGSASKNSAFLLERLNIKHMFDYIVDPSNLKSKPEPDIFLAAMNYFGMNHEQCIGFEDAIAGVKAIKRAGMFAIGIGNDDLEMADLQYPSLKDINYDLLNEVIEGKYEIKK